MILALGSKGDDVKTLQVALKSSGFFQDAIDGDFGPKTEAAVRSFQASRSLPVDGIVGSATWTAVLKPPISARSATSGELDAKLAEAGRAAVAAMAKLWALDVYNAQPNDQTPHGIASRAVIEDILTATGWSSYVPYDGRFAYCGLTVGMAWRSVGVDLATIAHNFSSTYRLDMWARYKSFDEKHPNPKPPEGQQRRILVELTQASSAVPIDPRAGDILMIGDGNPAAGDHVCLVESYDAELRVFRTIEGNGTGLAPDGKMRHGGIVRGVRHVGGPGYCARRLIRPAPSDLIA
jgi:peptidoglycan hydrolase-like protein with peptidoglycan-binding domain